MIADKSGERMSSPLPLALDNLVIADAWAQHQRIVQHRIRIEDAFLQLGKELAEFDEMHRWDDLGYSSFAAYLADPDVDISPRTAYRIIRVHEMTIRFSILPPVAIDVGSTKLDMLASHVNEENLEELLNKASALSRKDLKAELNGNPSVDWQAALRRTRYLCYLLLEHAPADVAGAAREFREQTR